VDYYAFFFCHVLIAPALVDIDGTLSLFVVAFARIVHFVVILRSCLGTKNAAALLSFLSGYSWYVVHLVPTFDHTPYPLLLCSFMGPLAGVMCSDYYLVRKCKLDVKELYNPNGLYRYTGGWNWRAYVAFLYVAFEYIAWPTMNSLTIIGNFQHPCICACSWSSVLNRSSAS
jgi:hypothetical protein